MRRTKLLFALILAGSACRGLDDLGYEPKLGPLVPDEEPSDAMSPSACPAPPGACGDSDPRVEVSFWRDIQPLMRRPARGCMAHTMPVMFDPSTYRSLRRGGENTYDDIVVPCRPCDSMLVHKLADPTPPFGARMPMTGYYWSDAELRLLRDWIAEGAQDN